MFLGLRSLIYTVTDLDKAKAWYTKALGVEPYYDQPPYVGYSLGGYELGLLAAGGPASGPRAYWGVPDIDIALRHFLDAGATLDADVSDVGGGIRMASVTDPEGLFIGIIENPVFELDPVANPGPGPGR